MQRTSELPPILPDIESVLKDYIICPERLPIHEYERNQEFWPRVPNVHELFDFDRTTCSTTLKVHRDPVTGKIIGFREVQVDNIDGNDNFASSLLKDEITTNFATLASQFSDPIIKIPQESSVDFTDLLSVAPGFDRGLNFGPDGCTLISDEPAEAKPDKREMDEGDTFVNLMDLVQREQDFLEIWSDNKTPEKSVKRDSVTKERFKTDFDEQSVLPLDEPLIPVIEITKILPKQTLRSQDKEWAVMLETTPESVRDFHERVPIMAQEYPFELDPFQKQAILKLEENCDVFVAAHTSAGKTVVAEYAIALSQRHKTRTIYTSPIKALSNQKYNDFKATYGDVGLVTGDFQINPTASCLIMTTEILRSILYGRKGKDVIRDLEYAIFDECHYINDPSRGYVWEEVLILLPDYVRIVLLSATVPNTIDFANWLGMTKRRKVYVVTTLYRPVPLEHYLYTGTGSSTKNVPYCIVDAKGKFQLKGHSDALESIASKKVNDRRFLDTETLRKQEATALIGLVYYLKSKELLPTIMFTFSRQQCDSMADRLRSIDLTTQKEKSRIKMYYMKALQALKEPDRQLPQILQMHSVLEKGIGVHHSGILPIVKEIVELLFKDGLVKVLLATETFAMGINMPARTVVFNSITKWDGSDTRYLKPAEYIQMAGRAGRRQMDDSGTVIIRCINNKVPDTETLKQMMLGKPEKLVSQFRLTYSTLLSVLSRGTLTVESMMSHSFYEIGHEHEAEILKVQLKNVQAELEVENRKDLGEHRLQLAKFYTAAAAYIHERSNCQPQLMKQSKVIKDLTPGRVLLIDHQDHYKKLAILLHTKKDSLIYKVLVLENQETELDSEMIHLREKQLSNKEPTPKKHSLDWYKMVSFTYDEIFQPSGVGGHSVLEISAIDITEITTITIKLDFELVVKDWDKRQIPRFRNDPPSQTCQQAIQELTKLTNSTISGVRIAYLNALRDFQISDIDLCLQLDQLHKKHGELRSLIACTKIANFEEEFQAVFKRKSLEMKANQLEYLISHESLKLYSEYKSRIQVLEEFGYIDKQNIVLFKGNVACGIGMNELLITELVLSNVFTNLPAAEVAALLSALVYQGRSNTETNLKALPDSLKHKITEVQETYRRIFDCETKHRVNNSVAEELNFSLIEVVYYWAKNEAFADIMARTDVQEGIIVRCIQQLNERIKDVWQAAIKIGDPKLQAKMEEASTVIKRDIVFAESLYTRSDRII